MFLGRSLIPCSLTFTYERRTGILKLPSLDTVRSQSVALATVPPIPGHFRNRSTYKGRNASTFHQFRCSEGRWSPNLGVTGLENMFVNCSAIILRFYQLPTAQICSSHEFEVIRPRLESWGCPVRWVISCFDSLRFLGPLMEKCEIFSRNAR